MPTSRSPRAVRACWLGSVPYRDVWALQRAAVERVRAGELDQLLLLLEHPHVFTMGRRATADHLLWDEAERERRGVEVVWCDRGGDVTYHGPGQLVGYPILDLPRLGSDVLRHIRDLERALIAYLATLGIPSEPGGPGLTGVWSAGEKVAAIGVKLNQTVTSHGFALNLTADLEYFTGIVPCGLEDKRPTSVLRLGGPEVPTEAAARDFVRHFSQVFQVEVAWADAAELDGLAAVAPPEPTRRSELPLVPTP